MAGKISDLSRISGLDRANDLFEVDDVSLATSKSATVNDMLGLTSAPLGTTETQSPTNKTFDNTTTITVKGNKFTLQDQSDTSKQAIFSMAGITTGNTRTYTLPNASGTLADLASAQTFTNKTFTSPVINTPTINNPTLNTDAISEFTGGNGVTVAGMNVKSGKLNTNNSVVTANITDTAVTPAKLTAGTGSGWALTSATPSWTNLTIGNAPTNLVYYIQTGKWVAGYFDLVLGSTTTVGTVPSFALPIAASTRYVVASRNYIVGRAWLQCAALNVEGSIGYNSSGLFINYFSGTPPAATNVTASAPGTWTTGNYITGSFAYEVA